MKNIFNTIIGLLLLVFVAGGCVDVSKILPRSETTPPQANNPTPTAAPITAPDNETEKLKEKIEALEKKVDESEPKTTSTPQIKEKIPTIPTIPDSRSNATVSASGDGFLAMRSQPSTNSGYRILKIPHRANVRVLGCQQTTTRVDGRSGRWCQVSYAGKSGWVFDGWLVYR